MSELALLDYTFIFDPSESWSNLHQFENQLVKYFHHLGLDANLITPVNSARGRVVLLKKLPEITPAPAKSEKSPKEQADGLRNG